MGELLVNGRRNALFGHGRRENTDRHPVDRPLRFPEVIFLAPSALESDHGQPGVYPRLEDVAASSWS